MTHPIDRPTFLGFGLGLRTVHYEHIINERPTIDWFEILSENYMIPGGKPLYFLDQISEHYPIVMHGVSMSLGSCDPINLDYLRRLKQLAKRVNARWISDHLCWTGVHGKNAHDLLPMPYDDESLNHIVIKINQVQDYLEQPILIENPSTYLTYKHSIYFESDFLNRLTEETGCLLLLDVNNIYVNSINHYFDADEYLKSIRTSSVQQIHLSGHRNLGDHIIDTHDEPIIQPVWALYEAACRRFGKISSMIERDDNIPPLDELLTEYQKMRAIAEAAWESEVAYA